MDHHGATDSAGGLHRARVLRQSLVLAAVLMGHERLDTIRVMRAVQRAHAGMSGDAIEGSGRVGCVLARKHVAKSPRDDASRSARRWRRIAACAPGHASATSNTSRNCCTATSTVQSRPTMARDESTRIPAIEHRLQRDIATAAAHDEPVREVVTETVRALARAWRCASAGARRTPAAAGSTTSPAAGAERGM